jgi:hypothetical protein
MAATTAGHQSSQCEPSPQLEPLRTDRRRAQERCDQRVRSQQRSRPLPDTGHNRFLVGKRMTTGVIRDVLERLQDIKR